MHGAAYYRGAMGILLVYDVTDETSFNNIRNWMRNIEQHASDNVNKARSLSGPDSRLLRCYHAPLHDVLLSFLPPIIPATPCSQAEM